MKPLATMFHNLRFKLNHKIPEDEFVKLLKDNMTSQMGKLLQTSPITSLAELKREGLRVDRWFENTGKNMCSPVNEIEESQTLEDFADAVTVEEFNRQRKHEGVMKMDKDSEARYTRQRERESTNVLESVSSPARKTKVTRHGPHG